MPAAALERELRRRADVLGLRGKRRRAYIFGTKAKIERARREHRARSLDLRHRFPFRRRRRAARSILARIVRRIW